MTTKRAEVIVGSENYHHREYYMRMTLARKGLLSHMNGVEPENKITEDGSQAMPRRWVSSLKEWSYSIRRRSVPQRVPGNTSGVLQP